MIDTKLQKKICPQNCSLCKDDECVLFDRKSWNEYIDKVVKENESKRKLPDKD